MIVARRGQRSPLVKKIQEAINETVDGGDLLTVDGDFGPATEAAVKDRQDAAGVDIDGIAGNDTLALFGALDDTDTEPVCVDPTEEGLRILEAMGQFESGGDWGALNHNSEYDGGCDRPLHDEHGEYLKPKDRTDRHGCSKYGPTPTWIGLSAGKWQFTEGSGALGEVLERIFKMFPGVGEAIFGTRLWREIVKGTNKRGPDEEREMRPGETAKVAASVRKYTLGYLCDKPLCDKIGNLLETPEGIEAQKWMIVRAYFIPAAKWAAEYGANDPTTIAMISDRFVGHGPGGAKRFLADAMKQIAEHNHDWKGAALAHWAIYSPNSNDSFAHRAPKIYDADLGTEPFRLLEEA